MGPPAGYESCAAPAPGSEQHVTVLKSVLVFTFVIYAGLLALLYVSQRQMMYLPDPRRIAPADAGFARATAHTLATADGQSIQAWYAPASPGRSLIVYFHGNGGQIAHRVGRFNLLTAGGDGVLAVSYRGYGGSSGSPTEQGLIEDGRAAYAFAIEQGYAPQNIVLFGESLGSGVAVALAAEKRVGGVLLEAPFSSTVDVAATVYWMFPLRLLMLDQFPSDRRIAQVSAPLLIVHGDRDQVVPLRFGQRLYDVAREPKTLLKIPGGGHQVLETPQAIDGVRRWLDTIAGS